MTEEHYSGASHAPFSIVAISVLLWSQGGIWAGLAVIPLYLSGRVPASDLITAVLLVFAVLSWVLAVLLLRRGSERARIGVIAQEIFMTFLGLAIFGTWILSFDGLFLVAPVELFIAAGIFMSACAVAGLLSGVARGYCHRRAAL
jgi:hypothetical protein